jgi:hypothetical protein
MVTDQRERTDTRDSDTLEARRDRYARILEFHRRLRNVLLQLRADVDVLTAPGATSTSDRPEGITPLVRLVSALDEALETARTGEARIQRELTHLLDPSTQEAETLTPGLARFVADRSGRPGFSYEVDNDPMRGQVLRWREVTEEGWVRGSGLLYENPHAWLGE